MKMKLLIFLDCIAIFYTGLFEKCACLGVCSKTEKATSYDGEFSYTKYFCCDNYERHRTGCKGCSLGFVSTAGLQCVSCPKGTFGMRCAEYCSCKQSEKCDHKLGCVIRKEDATGRTTEFTSYKRNNTFDQNPESTYNTESLSTIKVRSSTEFSQSSVKTSTMQVQSNTHSLKPNMDYPSSGLTVGRVILISSGSTLLIGILIAGLFLAWKYVNLKRKAMTRVKSVSISNDTLENVSQSGENTINIYHEIDDTQVCSESVFIIENKSEGISLNSLSKSSSTFNNENDGYLYPCNTIENDSKTSIVSRDKPELADACKHYSMLVHSNVENIDTSILREDIQPVYLELISTNGTIDNVEDGNADASLLNSMTISKMDNKRSNTM